MAVELRVTARPPGNTYYCSLQQQQQQKIRASVYFDSLESIKEESMASQQPLRRVGLDERIVSRMTSEGLHTVGDLFSKTELQLVQVLNLNQFEVVNLLCSVANRMAPETKTAGDLLRERRETGGSFFVATGLPTIDNSLQVQLPLLLQ